MTRSVTVVLLAAEGFRSNQLTSSLATGLVIYSAGRMAAGVILIETGDWANIASCHDTV